MAQVQLYFYGQLNPDVWSYGAGEPYTLIANCTLAAASLITGILDICLSCRACKTPPKPPPGATTSTTAGGVAAA